jgi:hypothetical protein
VWIVRETWFGAHPAGVPVVNVTTMSVVVVPVFEALVRRGGVIWTLARCSRLWIRRLLVAPAATAAAAVPIASSRSTPKVGNAMLMLSCVVGLG